MIAVLIVFIAVNKKKESDEKNQNKTATRQILDGVTVNDTMVRKIDTPLTLTIHQACCRAPAASVVVSNTLEALSILH